jgi:hypothetical protein
MATVAFCADMSAESLAILVGLGACLRHTGWRSCRCSFVARHQLLLEPTIGIRKVLDLLGHKHVTTTQICDKRRRDTSDSASHLLVI